MKIRINRYLLEKEYTMGKLYINDVFICDTLEDAYRGDDLKYRKVAGQTCIPCGKYEVRMTESPKFKRVLPEIINVSFFSGIRIHNGSTNKDTQGCILVGKKQKDGLLINSRDTLNYLINNLSMNKPIELEIKIGYF